MQKLTFDQISQTYNGRTGCACGCNGTYSLPSDDLIEAANKRTGWEAYDADSVRPRACKIALSKINKAIEEYGPLAQPCTGHYAGAFEYHGKDVWFFYGPEFVAIDKNGRATTVYTREYK